MVVFNLWLLPCQRCVNGIALHVFHTYEAATFTLKQSDADVLWRLCGGFFLVSAAVVPIWNFHRTISVTENDRKYLKVGVKMCREYKMGIIALLFCPCGVPASEKHFHRLQVSASKFKSDNLFLYVAPLITGDKCGCHTEVLSDCDRSVISSCSTYMSGDDGSDCFPLCGGSISSICILHLHLKHSNTR